MSSLLRCITADEKALIATNSEKEVLKSLSKEKQLFCPNCKSTVIFKSGRVMRPHFAHHDSDCVITNYEPETASHLKGKQILYEWLKNKFPTADIEYEVYIPETNQIADIFVEHEEGEFEGLRWAFEFQHSSLKSAEWATRHELYKSAGIQDFWVLDKAKHMKFSKAQDVTDARLRNELEKEIYKNTGLCYFLDLETSELTIDFNFTTSSHTTVVRGVERRNEYTYHSPIKHSTNIDKVRVRMNDEFRYCVLTYSEIEIHMEERLSWILSMLRKERAKKEEEELQKKAKEMKLFAIREYGEKQAEIIWDFMKQNKEKLTGDIMDLSLEDFFAKYKPLVDKLRQDIKEYRLLEKSDDLVDKLIKDLTYSRDFYSLTFLTKQGSSSLGDYLRTVYKEKIDLVTYVYSTYKKDLEKLANMSFEAIKYKLEKIKPSIVPRISDPTPTAIDFVIRYKNLETREAADELMKKVKEQIIYYNPFEKVDG